MHTRLGGHLQNLLAAVQGAASLAEVQRAYVETVGSVIDARAHGIYWFPRGDRARMRLEVRGAAEDFIAEYERVGPTGDPVLAALVRARRPVRSDELMPLDRWRRLPFHATLARAGLDHTLQAPVLHGGTLVGTLNVARPAAAPQFDARDALVLGVLSVHIGAAYRRAERFDALIRRAAAPSGDALDVLSPREREVARLVVAGLSNHDAAAALGVAESTVKEHLKRIFRKLGVASRQELTRVALLGASFELSPTPRLASVSLFRGIDPSSESERGARAQPALEERRKATRSGVLGTGTLACHSCDAPIDPGPRPLSLTESLMCPFCATRGAVRDFLSLSTPTRPAHVVIRVALPARR